MKGTFCGKYNSRSEDRDGKMLITLEVDKEFTFAAKQIVAEFLREKEKTVQVDFSDKKRKRSLNANAYFHLLVGKIAEKMNLGEDETKVKMVLEYGTVAEEAGETVIVALPKSAEAKSYYPYAKWIGDFAAKNGKQYSQYIFYKQTHTLDSKEMARLIDGVAREAEELGIETMTPAELAGLCDRWSPKGVQS